MNQHAFLKGQNIMDNVIVAHEILHSINQTKEPDFLLKLDFDFFLIPLIGITYYLPFDKWGLILHGLNG
jgi:hypothetical protein